MRWDALFADLQTQVSAQQQEDFEANVAETIALEWSRTGVADRLRAHVGQRPVLTLQDGQSVHLDIRSVGSDWLSGVGSGHQWLIPLSALQTISGLMRRSEAEASPVRQRLSITSPLRALAQAREHVTVHLASGVLIEGGLLGVGRDFLDIRSDASVQPVRTVPLGAVTAVRSVWG